MLSIKMRRFHLNVFKSMENSFATDRFPFVLALKCVSRACESVEQRKSFIITDWRRNNNQSCQVSCMCFRDKSGGCNGAFLLLLSDYRHHFNQSILNSRWIKCCFIFHFSSTLSSSTRKKCPDHGLKYKFRMSRNILWANITQQHSPKHQQSKWKCVKSNLVAERFLIYH